MAAQEYKVLQFKIGDFQDNYGNTWCDMALEGVGEPVRIVVKDPTTIKSGDVLFGEIKEHESKAGKTYQRFHRVQREQQSFAPQGKREWQPRDDDAIRAQWSIGQARELYGVAESDAKPLSQAHLAVIETNAKAFYAMVDRVKGSTSQASLTNDPGETKEFSNESDAYQESLAKSWADNGDTPVNLDDIPF